MKLHFGDVLIAPKAFSADPVDKPSNPQNHTWEATATLLGSRFSADPGVKEVIGSPVSVYNRGPFVRVNTENELADQRVWKYITDILGFTDHVIASRDNVAMDKFLDNHAWPGDGGEPNFNGLG